MATVAEIQERAARSRRNVLTDAESRELQINRTSNERITSLINEQFLNRTAVLNKRLEDEQKIADLRAQYVDATRDVLNDQTLEFLISQSKINAPTFTAIQAGFELARASDVERGQQRVDSIVEGVRQQQEINQALSEVDTDRVAQLQDLETQTRELQLGQSSRRANTEDDIISDEAGELSLERREQAKIAARQRDGLSDNLFTTNQTLNVPETPPQVIVPVTTQPPLVEETVVPDVLSEQVSSALDTLEPVQLETEEVRQDISQEPADILPLVSRTDPNIFEQTQSEEELLSELGRIPGLLRPTTDADTIEDRGAVVLGNSLFEVDQLRDELNVGGIDLNQASDEEIVQYFRSRL